MLPSLREPIIGAVQMITPKILVTAIIALAVTCTPSALALDQAQASSRQARLDKTSSFRGQEKLYKIVEKANKENWRRLPIGELMGKIALQLENTPYEAGTLENSADFETCSANLDALDCVTFFESTLDLARMLKKGKSQPEDLLKELKLTRYRGGVIDDYSSRLHYTTDWYADNESKHIVQILSNLPGAESFTQKVAFMSSNPGSYKQLAAHPELIEKMKAKEFDINQRNLTFVPVDKVAAIEPLLRTGDIVGLCTSLPGLDITHTGLIFRDKDGVAHFMDASSRKNVMKVVIEPGPISETLMQSKKRSANLTGVMLARPLEPIESTD